MATLLQGAAQGVSVTPVPALDDNYMYLLVDNATSQAAACNESGALRYTVFEPTEDHVVRSVAEYAHAKAREKHAALAGPTRDHFATPAAALAETEALEFADAAHLEKGDT